MAYYYRRKRYWKRRRPFRYRWRRFRRPFWRRRRYKYKVRRKLPYLHLKEWQPKVIRKFAVKGMYCLLQTNHKLINHNYTQYMESIPREGEPSGGGFSLNKFTLNCLYSEHEKARNVWTKGNKNLPLIRYTGCRFRIYRPKNMDAVIKFQNCYPMTATNLTYVGTQPYIMSLSKNSYKISRLDNTSKKKPYKQFKFPPPQQMTNKWFFSADIANKGLIMLAASAASFDQFYISKSAESDTVTLHVLNTKIFQNRQFKPLTTSGYHPKDNYWLYATLDEGEHPKIGSLIFLGNTEQYKEGTEFQKIPDLTTTSTVENLLPHLTNPDYWGNPFHHHYTQQNYHLFFTQTSPSIFFNSHKNKKLSDTTEGLSITRVTQELYFTVRYNPNRDKGTNSQIYLKSNWQAQQGWDPPANPNLILTGFPLWLLTWGWIDYHLKLAEITNLETHYITVIQSDAIEPQDLHLDAWVILDIDFLNGDSEWHPGQGRTDWDNLNWYPMNHYQHRSLEVLGQSGPATPKLGKDITDELHCEYAFYFKSGGCVPPMDKITDPSKQPIYPIPTNIADPNSLQSPTEPIESYLYEFDERRGQITKTAAERISKDYKPTKTLFTDSETSGSDVPVLQTFQEIQDSSEEEETKETSLFQQLLKQRNKQQLIRQRIQRLLKEIQHTT
nr:MAG: ORF1 [TTV-like mini virus]